MNFKRFGALEHGNSSRALPGVQHIPFLPLITNLGKIAATLAAGTVGYANRKTFGRWLVGDD